MSKKARKASPAPSLPIVATSNAIDFQLKQAKGTKRILPPPEHPTVKKVCIASEAPLPLPTISTVGDSQTKSSKGEKRPLSATVLPEPMKVRSESEDSPKPKGALDTWLRPP